MKNVEKIFDVSKRLSLRPNAEQADEVNSTLGELMEAEKTQAIEAIKMLLNWRNEDREKGIIDW